MSNNSISLPLLNRLAGSKTEIHKNFNSIYYLPRVNSKAINKDYLRLIAFLPNAPEIFLAKRENIIFEQIPPLCKDYCLTEFLELLEKILLDKQKPPTGFNGSLPDFKWTLRMIRHIDPLNEYKAFGRKISIEETYSRNVNPE